MTAKESLIDSVKSNMKNKLEICDPNHSSVVFEQNFSSPINRLVYSNYERWFESRKGNITNLWKV